MTTRVLSWIAIVVCGTLLLCAGLGTVLFRAGATGPTDCHTPASTTSMTRTPTPAMGPVGRWNAEQVGNAAAIITAGMRTGVPPRGWVVAVATAMQESSLVNLPDGDRDSVGLFQQRPSQGWGTRAQLQDPAYAATVFYQRLQAVDGWQAMPLTDAAQAVQRSAYPDAYARWEPDAVTLVQALTGAAGGPGGCAATVSAHGWTQPVRGPVGSEFRTGDRPGHDGVDIAAPKGTAIRAAAAGVVSVVRCNAVHAGTGADYGCDRDGHPQLVRGCGWYLDITHAGGVITRYCRS